jgi:hypothetical protein
MGRTLYDEPQRAIAGQQYGLTGKTRTYIAGEKIYPGDPVFGMVGDEHMCYTAHINAVTLTASANLLTGNEVAVTVNTIDLAPIAFVDNTAKTLEAIVQAIELDADISELGITAFVVEGLNAITIVGPGIDITASAVVSGGASQAGFSSSADTNLKFIGVAEHTELSFVEGTGFYPPSVAVNVREYGEIYVTVDEDAEPGDKEPAYIDLAKGVFTDVVGSNYNSGAIFRSSKEDGLARVEVRGLN